MKDNNTMDAYPPSLSFVAPDWLEAALGDARLRIVQLDGEKYYQQFHIPGAAQTAYARLVTKRNDIPGMMADLSDLVPEIERLGIGNATPVVAYDLTGGLDAARFLWTLASSGHTGFKAVLDGGLSAWYSQKRRMESGIATYETVAFQGKIDARWLVGHKEVLAISEGKTDALLVDTRSAKEYQGLTIRAPRGHIRGARHYDWTDSLIDPKDMRLKDPGKIKGQLDRIGISDTTQEIVLYCETAHRAAHTWLLLRHLGYEKVRLYDGSIAEWRVLNLPVTMME
ncbi:MAG TPA: sulfurtransferase [Magnetococcales bacterium]|nr:sulfurtransferase [Magnetococcales bacterium]